MEKSFVSSIYPTTKGLIVILAILASIFYDWQLAYLVILPLCFIFAAIDNQFVSYLKKVAATLFIVVVVMFFFQFVVDDSTTNIYFDLGFLQITQAGIDSGLSKTKIIVAMVSTIILFFSTTDLEDLMISLQNMNLSHVATFVMMSTMQMIPEMLNKSKIIMSAQQARGIETEGNLMQRAKAFFPSLGPLIISSLTEIEDRTVTLEVRGFSIENKKTTLKDLRKSSKDKTLEIGAIILFVGLIAGRFFI